MTSQMEARGSRQRVRLRHHPRIGSNNVIIRLRVSNYWPTQNLTFAVNAYEQPVAKPKLNYLSGVSTIGIDS